MGEQNGNLAAIENFLVENAKEISELKIELLKLHFKEILKLAENIDLSKLNDIIPEGKKRGDKLIALLENFKKNDGGLYEYDADIFDNDDTEIDAIRTKNLLFSIVRSLYLILCTSKQRGELTVLKDSLDKFKFNKDNGDIEKYIKTYEKYAKYIDSFKKFFPSINLQPELKEESKVVPPVQKRGVFSRLFGSNKKSGAINIEDSLKKIEESIKKQREEYAQVDIKEGEEDNINRSITDAETKLSELKEVKEKIDALNEKINDEEIVNKKMTELKDLKEKSEKTKEKNKEEHNIFFKANSAALRSFDILEKNKEKDKDTNGFKELYDKNKSIKDEYDRIKTDTDANIDNAKKAIAAADKELTDLKKNPKDNKKRLIKEAQQEKETAETKFREIEETLNNAIKEIQEQINENKKDKKSGGGGKRIKYKSTGNEVVIFHKNRECRKTIYVKEKTTTKYCKINNKYILLSKLNVID
jgi:hypothetical protein